MEDSADCLLRKAYVSAERLLLRLGEALTARLAFEPLDTIAPESSFYHFDFAVVARQFGPCFLRASASKMTVDLDNPAFGAIPRLGPMSGSRRKWG